MELFTVTTVAASLFLLLLFLVFISVYIGSILAHNLCPRTVK